MTVESDLMFQNISFKYTRNVGNNEIAAIARTVMVPWVVTNNVLYNVRLPDHCSVPT